MPHAIDAEGAFPIPAASLLAPSTANSDVSGGWARLATARDPIAVLDWIRELYSNTADPRECLRALDAVAEAFVAQRSALHAELGRGDEPEVSVAAQDAASCGGTPESGKGPVERATQDADRRVRGLREELQSLAGKEEALETARGPLRRLLEQSAHANDVWAVFRDVLVHPPNERSPAYRGLTRSLQRLAAAPPDERESAGEAVRTALSRFLEPRVRALFSPRREPRGAQPAGSATPSQSAAVENEPRTTCDHSLASTLGPAWPRDVPDAALDEPLGDAERAFLDFLVDEVVRALMKPV